MQAKEIYKNEAITVELQVELLANQGLLIPNTSEAEFHLSTVNYHRLSNYCLVFYENLKEKKFKSNTTFNDVWDLYVFDRKLRVLVSDALERIEIAFRTSIINAMSVKYGTHWYLNQNHFKNTKKHEKFIRMIKELCGNSHESAIHLYRKKYSSPEYPPFWVLTECISFGTLSKLFGNIKVVSDKKEISKIFDYHPTLLDSWMNALTYTRNICAHHSRLWNRWFINEPKDIIVYNENMKRKKPFYQQACVIKKLLQKISPGSHWTRELYVLISENKHFPIWQMGFLEDWENDPFWKGF